MMKAGLKDVLTVEEWLAKHLSSGDTVGIDPYLSSVRSVEYVCWLHDAAAIIIVVCRTPSSPVALLSGGGVAGG